MGTASPPNHTHSKDRRLTKLQPLSVTCEDEHPVNQQLHPVPGARLFQDAPVPARLQGSYKWRVWSQITVTEADNMHSLNKRTLETLKAAAPVVNGPFRLRSTVSPARLWPCLVWVATGDCHTTEVPHIHLLSGFGRRPVTVVRRSLLLGNLKPALGKCD